MGLDYGRIINNPDLTKWRYFNLGTNKYKQKTPYYIIYTNSKFIDLQFYITHYYCYYYDISKR